MNTENLPKLYTDRDNQSALDHYVVVSYSHEDSDIVYADLNRLYDLGVKFWYDRGLEIGSDEWFKQVQNRIEDARCAAVMFYVSPNAIYSDAIEKEISMVFGDKKVANKSYFSVNIGKSLIKDIIVEFNSKVLSGEKDNKKLTYDDFLRKAALFNSAFKDDFPHINRLSLDPDYDEHIDELFEKLKKFNITSEAIDNELVGYPFLNYVKDSHGIGRVEFGSYPQEKQIIRSIFAMKGVWNDDKSILKIDNSYYKKENNSFYLIKPILWRIMKYEDKKLWLISEKCLDCQLYHDSFASVKWEDSFLCHWLNDQFFNLAFSDKEKQMIVQGEDGFVTLPTIEQLTSEDFGFDTTYDVSATREVEPTAYALDKGAYSGPNGKVYWWYKLPYGNAAVSGFVYDNGGINNYTGATRAQIVIDLTKAYKA